MNRGGWNWKQWRQEDGMEAVVVGRIDCVSHWFENSCMSNEMCHPRNERTWPWKDSNCGIGGDFSDENSFASTERRREKRMACDV